VNPTLRHRGRLLIDRLARPYVDEVVRSVHDASMGSGGLSAPGADSPAASMVPSDRFHLALHELRTLELERVPWAGADVLSVGANGAWYFEWFRRAYGDVDRHVGVEAFEPRPADLPPYAQWVEYTADQMVDVATGSIDLVFAGQTSEHLWQHELVGFLLEAHRVLRPGGLLVLDSPNRIITEQLHWSHGGHSIEISAGEASKLIELAGFDVAHVAGLWDCTADGQVLALEVGIDDPACLLRRAMAARERPDDCFVWWINAGRSDRQPDRAALTDAVGALFTSHWPARVSRGFFPGPGRHLPLEPGNAGRLAATLPFMLHAGTWRGRLRAVEGSLGSVLEPVVLVELPGGQVLARLPVSPAGEFEFEIASVTFAASLVLEAQAISERLSIGFPIELDPVTTP
jgi:SAM-dependent methyltransferase